MTYCAIGLVNPKNSLNVGSVLRAAGVYDAAFIATTGKRYKKTVTDTMKTYKQKPLFRVKDLRDIIPFDCVPVAVDLVSGAIALPEYEHPKNAFYIFGAEDATLGRKTLDWCRDIVYIPTAGCMNLAATVNVVLYDRLLKTVVDAAWRNRLAV